MLMEMGICNGLNLPNTLLRTSVESKNQIIRTKLLKKMKLYLRPILRYQMSIKLLRLSTLGITTQLKKLYISENRQSITSSRQAPV